MARERPGNAWHRQAGPHGSTFDRAKTIAAKTTSATRTGGPSARKRRRPFVIVEGETMSCGLLEQLTRSVSMSHCMLSPYAKNQGVLSCLDVTRQSTVHMKMIMRTRPYISNNCVSCWRTDEVYNLYRTGRQASERCGTSGTSQTTHLMLSQNKSCIILAHTRICWNSHPDIQA